MGDKVWYIGDACKPESDPSHPVMFIYDMDPRNGFKYASCNWLWKGEMRRRDFPVSELERADRRQAAH